MCDRFGQPWLICTLKLRWNVNKMFVVLCGFWNVPTIVILQILEKFCDSQNLLAPM
jgi:hypothetical protein